ncbi:MAG: restriction endonuclease subunit S [Paludibacter sp.]|nr:restriction endonuclease subunit S [Bacteroidales bacterium]MCM1069022.1 restriction endonuclease subunit S [Prevotella sp.]MCM1353685.1 restriction endonuclease subunit S [Bacteroides sp.]MCM1441966.1 restriction endonuclease subunit S [Muribaculum sp.]MCM1481578.1 restriction endonuclease subunit S [Paludibacter sp.]
MEKKGCEDMLSECTDSHMQDMCRSCNVPIVRLGDYITQRREKNKDYHVPIRGVTRDGFIAPKQDGDLSMYNVFYRYDFVFNPARMEINSIALNTEWDKAICSSLYEVFYVNDTSVLLPQYLNLYLKRDEFARYCKFDAIGSARNYYRVYNIAEVCIPLPSIEVQRELVAVYEGLKHLAETNEAMLTPLAQACEAFIVDCKKQYPTHKLGEYIEECDERNTSGEITLSQGISNLKYFQTPKQVAENSKSDKIVRKGQFAYNRATTRNGEKISIAYREEEDCTVSSAYGVFYITNENNLLPQYLMLFFKRAEFDRFARWRSEGSAHEFFTFDMMYSVQIPLPPITVQQKIVELYQCYEECKRIATEAREQLKTICPALVQKVTNS